MCDEVIAGPTTEAELEAYYAAQKEAWGPAGWEWYKNPAAGQEAAVAAVEAKFEQVFCEAEGTRLRGDLLLCDAHAGNYAPNVGRVPGEVKCSCGFFRPVGTSCGEPCL